MAALDGRGGAASRRSSGAAPPPRCCARLWRSRRWASACSRFIAATRRCARCSITTIWCCRRATLLCGAGIPPWVLFKLDGGIDHILIDEAQDTNPEQWEVVAKLADEFFAGLAARTVRRTVFAVGDAKQSIFSFQRADPARFIEMRRHFERKVREARQDFRPVTLDISFRSTEAVLAAVDATFARAEAAQGVALDGEPIRHRAFRTGQAGLGRAVAAGRAGRAAYARPVGAAHRAAPRERAAAPPRRKPSPRPSKAGSRAASGSRRATGGSAPGDVLVLVRRRTPFVAALVRALEGARRRGRRRRPHAARRSARGRGHDGAAASSCFCRRTTSPSPPCSRVRSSASTTICCSRSPTRAARTCGCGASCGGARARTHLRPRRGAARRSPRPRRFRAALRAARGDPGRARRAAAMAGAARSRMRRMRSTSCWPPRSPMSGATVPRCRASSIGSPPATSR